MLAYIDITLIKDVRDVPKYDDPVLSNRNEWASDFAAVRDLLACDGYQARRVHAGLFARAVAA